MGNEEEVDVEGKVVTMGTKKDEEMVCKITKEKPFFLQYVPIFLNGIVKVDVVVMKVVNNNNDEGKKKSKKRERQGYEHI